MKNVITRAFSAARAVVIVCGCLSAPTWSATEDVSLRSNSVEVGFISHHVVVSDGVVKLLSESSDGVTTASSLVLRKHPVGKISAIRLARWMRRSVCFVLAIDDGEVRRFHLVLGTVVNGVLARQYEELIYSGPKTYRVLSLHGDYGDDTVFVCIGELRRIEHGNGAVKEGVFFLHECPRPPDGGVLSSFEATSTIRGVVDFERLLGEQEANEALQKRGDP